MSRMAVRFQSEPDRGSATLLLYLEPIRDDVLARTRHALSAPRAPVAASRSNADDSSTACARVGTDRPAVSGKVGGLWCSETLLVAVDADGAERGSCSRCGSLYPSRAGALLVSAEAVGAALWPRRAWPAREPPSRRRTSPRRWRSDGHGTLTAHRAV